MPLDGLSTVISLGGEISPDLCSKRHIHIMSLRPPFMDNVAILNIPTASHLSLHTKLQMGSHQDPIDQLQSIRALILHFSCCQQSLSLLNCLLYLQAEF